MVATKIVTGLATVGSGYSAPNRRITVPARTLVRSVMASPPTTTLSTTHTITSPRAWLSASGSIVPATSGTSFSYVKGGGITQVGTSFPDCTFVKSKCVNLGATVGANVSNVAYSTTFLHDGSELEIVSKGTQAKLIAKVDDQYVSLTPTTLANDGSTYYWYFPFGSRALRRIEIMGYSNAWYFGGVYTGPNDTILPASPRGPRTIVIGDSYTGLTGTTSPINGWPFAFADAMGWDDVWASGVGSTGYLANASAAAMTFRDRIVADCTSFNPDVVIIAGGINDSATSAALVGAEAATLYAQIKAALPNALLVVVSPFWPKGAGSTIVALWNVKAAIKAAAVAAGALWLDILEMPTPYGMTMQSTTLASSAALSATSLSTTARLGTNATYAFADGTRVYVTSTSGGGPFTANLEGTLVTAQASGATLTQVGDSMFTGSGRVGLTTGIGNCDLYISSDGSHPTDAGHTAIGQAVATLLVKALSPA
jgi:lysophospholipase L1-like esterase